MFKKLLSLVLFSALPCSSIASTVNIDADPGWVRYKSLHGIRDDTATRGGDLTGMLVTASYLDGSTEEAVWDSTRGGGQSTGSGFNLFYGWSEFQLSVTRSLVSLSLDARSGNAVFDISRSRLAGEDTYGTKRGYPFEVVGTHDPEGVIDVSYSNGFFVAGHGRAPDAYTSMLIDFSGLNGSALSGDLQFRTDLDSLEVTGDMSSVPLPASLLMLVSAFGIAGAAARKRTVR